MIITYTCKVALQLPQFVCEAGFKVAEITWLYGNYNFYIINGC